MYNIMITFITEFWLVIGQMAPYLLLGYFFAGILSILITPEWIERHLGGSNFSSTVKAAILGMPLPLCSCGVIPVTASIRKHGAGKGATASFLISTPTTGVDSILAAWALLGPVFAIYRAIMAVLIGILGGTLANLFDGDEQELLAKHQETKNEEKKDCCAHKVKATESKLVRIFKHGFVAIPKDIGRALFIGIVIAAIISSLISANVIDQFLGAGFGSMLLMLVIGIPLYVCATASIPLAIGFMALGASPGAALVFLIAGPATNAATLTVLWKMIGKYSTVAVLLAIIFGALASGVLLDYAWGFLDMSPINPIMHHHDSGEVSLEYIFNSVCAVILILVQLYSSFGTKIFASKKPASCCGSSKESKDDKQGNCCH